jgi:hypothetical protein
MPDEQLEVSCARTAEGWTCQVRVGDDPAATVHRVTVSERARDELGADAGVEELVRASFAFLLEREPRTSILRSFDLPVIERYFPDYRDAMARQFQRRPPD